MTRKQLISLFGLLSLLVIDVFLLITHFYLRYQFLDTPLHFLGGFFISMFLIDYLELNNHRYLKKIFILVSAAVFVGVFWEFFEYILSNLFDSYLDNNLSFMGNLDDTISDLAMDFLGAITFSLVGLSQARPNYSLAPDGKPEPNPAVRSELA